MTAPVNETLQVLYLAFLSSALCFAITMGVVKWINSTTKEVDDFNKGQKA